MNINELNGTARDLLAVRAMIAELEAPLMVSIISQFFLPIQKPRIARSLALLSIGTSPSSQNTLR